MASAVVEPKSATSLNPTPGVSVRAAPTVTDNAADAAASAAAAPSVKPATLGALFDWRNQNSVTFCRREDGLIWVANVSDEEISPTIAAAIHAHQATLTAFVSTDLTPTEQESCFKEFRAKVMAIPDPPNMTPANCRIGDDGRIEWLNKP